MDRAAKWLLTPADVAELLDVSARTINRWAADQKIPAVRLPSGKFRFLRREIEQQDWFPDEEEAS